MNELFLNRMKEYLKDDYQKYLLSLDKENIRGLKLNTKYINDKDFLSIFPFKLKQIENLNSSFIVLDDVKFGFDQFHHAGAFYIQDPSTMLPVEMIPDNIRPHFILDLCASPGGKTIDLSLKYPDSIIISNEIDYKRAKILYQNIERLGISNVIVTNNKVEDFVQDFSGSFDLVLIDSPCSGEGMFRKYEEALTNWSIDNILNCSLRDKDILKSARKLLKKDGYLVYSTCTFAREENEDIVKFLIDYYDFETVNIDCEKAKLMSLGFMPNTYRVYPFNNFGEGQFMALLKNNLENQDTTKYEKNKPFNIPELKQFINSSMPHFIPNIVLKDNIIYHKITTLKLDSLNVLNYGIKLGYINNKTFKPDHNLFKCLSSEFVNHINLNYGDELIDKYLRCEQIDLSAPDGYGVLLVEGIPLGGFKAKNNKLNNYYPKILRNF